MIALALLAAGVAADEAQLQRQLDFMVASCRAGDVVRLVAHGTRAVELRMVDPGRIPTVRENAALQCAIGKVRARRDLQLGFTGNEARH